jgi:hypothetical protein
MEPDDGGRKRDCAEGPVKFFPSIHILHFRRSTFATVGRPESYFDSFSKTAFTFIWPLDTVIFRSHDVKPLFFTAN